MDVVLTSIRPFVLSCSYTRLQALSVNSGQGILAGALAWNVLPHIMMAESTRAMCVQFLG